ncbi:spo11/DNA topoisomerase VI, subunit A protein [Wolffia australiana]
MAERKRRRGSSSAAGKGKVRGGDSESPAILFKDRLKEDSIILATLRQLYAAEQSSGTSTKIPTLADLGLSSTCREVSDRDPTAVRSSIEESVLATARSILDGRGFSFFVPSRSSSNQIYVPELDRIVLRDKSSVRSFSNLSTVRKTTITVRLLSLIHQLCTKNIHVTKRDLFYTDVKLFQDQTQSDAVLDDVSCMLGCTRSSLNVVASEKGVVVGRLIFTEQGDRIDCTKMGVGGKAIPPNIDHVGDMESDALFILLVEKDAAFMRLAEDRFYHRFPCIIVTAKGQPDVATRLFLKKMKTDLRLPVLALVDSDPYGLKILSVYMCGSKNMSYDSSNLTTPDIKWLGIRPSDLDKYKIPDQCRLPMTDQDLKTGKDLLEEEFVKKSDGWVRELELMVRTKQKAEIQALSSFGFQYLTEVYLPLKLQEKDWI